MTVSSWRLFPRYSSQMFETEMELPSSWWGCGMISYHLHNAPPIQAVASRARRHSATGMQCKRFDAHEPVRSALSLGNQTMRCSYMLNSGYYLEVRFSYAKSICL